MASTVKNLKPKLQSKKSVFYADESEETVSSDFYKEAEKVVLTAAAKERISKMEPEQKQMPEVNQEKNKTDQQVHESPPADSFDDFDFVEAYDDAPMVSNSLGLPQDTSRSAISCSFIGVGGGGGKLAKAFMDLGFTKTLLVNTTVKDQPEGINPEHFLLLPGADAFKVCRRRRKNSLYCYKANCPRAS